MILDSDGRGQVFRGDDVASSFKGENLDLQAMLITGNEPILATWTRSSINLRDVNTLAPVTAISPW